MNGLQRWACVPCLEGRKLQLQVALKTIQEIRNFEAVALWRRKKYKDKAHNE